MCQSPAGIDFIAFAGENSTLLLFLLAPFFCARPRRAAPPHSRIYRVTPAPSPGKISIKLEIVSTRAAPAFKHLFMATVLENYCQSSDIVRSNIRKCSGDEFCNIFGHEPPTTTPCVSEDAAGNKFYWFLSRLQNFCSIVIKFHKRQNEL